MTFFGNQPPASEIRRRMHGFGSWIEVDLDRLGFNLDQIRKRVGVDVMPVIKNNAYGHGLVPMAEFLHEQGIRWFLVAKLHEAERVRAACPGSRVLLMDALFGDESFERVVRGGITQALFTLEMAEHLSATATRLGRPVSIFVKVDTGLRRVGVRHDQAADFIERVVALPNIELRGVFSSFMQQPDEDQRMLARFLEVCGELAARGIEAPLRTMASTNAIFHQPAAWLDMVRPAMCLLGIHPFPGDVEAGLDLRPVLELKARIEYAKEVGKGESLTYFGAFIAPERMRIGTLHVGFYDGLPRELANKLRVRVGNVMRRGLGSIALNHSLVDLTGTDAKVGDEVVVYGCEGENTLNEMAKAAGWMVYSVMNHLNPYTPRVYLRGGEPVGLLDLTRS